MAVRNETIEAVFTDEQGKVAEWTLPAHSVLATELVDRVLDLLQKYVDGSLVSESDISLADFILFLVPQAAHDPLEG